MRCAGAAGAGDAEGLAQALDCGEQQATGARPRPPLWYGFFRGDAKDSRKLWTVIGSRLWGQVRGLLSGMQLSEETQK